VTDEQPAVETAVVYGLGELAAESGVSERTIRYYQAEELLPKPTKRGREAVYGEAHVERLALIAELRDRGLTLQTIRELVANENPARTVSEWLGVDATLSAPWSDDRARTVSHDELVALVARGSGNRPGLIGQLDDGGYVVSQRDGSWLVPSPTLLDHALRLRQAGIDIEISARMRDLLRRRLSSAVDDTVKLIIERTGAGFAGGASAEELATAVGALRPVAREMSSVILAQEVERALAGLVQSGPRSLRRARGH
jgi:DNA-binding transcriptional MerR regulator